MSFTPSLTLEGAEPLTPCEQLESQSLKKKPVSPESLELVFEAISHILDRLEKIEGQSAITTELSQKVRTLEASQWTQMIHHNEAPRITTPPQGTRPYSGRRRGQR